MTESMTTFGKQPCNTQIHATYRWPVFLMQAARLARLPASPTSLIPVVELSTHPACQDYLATTAVLSASVPIIPLPLDMANSSSTSSTSSTVSCVWTELLAIYLRVANQAAVASFHIKSSSTARANIQSMLSLVSRIVSAVERLFKFGAAAPDRCVKFDQRQDCSANREGRKIEWGVKRGLFIWPLL